MPCTYIWLNTASCLPHSQGLGQDTLAKQLCRMVDMWVAAIDRGDINGVIILLDFRKAFDLINHECLLKKLNIYQCGDNANSHVDQVLPYRQNTPHIIQRASLGDCCHHSGRATGFNPWYIAFHLVHEWPSASHPQWHRHVWLYPTHEWSQYWRDTTESSTWFECYNHLVHGQQHGKSHLKDQYHANHQPAATIP